MRFYDRSFSVCFTKELAQDPGIFARMRLWSWIANGRRSGRGVHCAAKFNNFTVHSNNRDFALLPPYCSKEKAVSYLYQKLKLNDKSVVFSIGDSMTDLGFMKRADFMIIPTHSQISEAMHD